MKKKIIGAVCAGLLFVPCMGLTGCNHEHNYAKTWTNDSTNHWHACTTCGQADEKKEHDWDEGTVTVQPTSTTDGTKLVVCEDCNLSKTIVVPKNTTLVSEDEWETVLDFSKIEHFQFSFGNMFSVVKDGDIIYQRNIQSSTDFYATIEGGKYYQYRKQSDVWTKTETDKSEYDTINLANQVFGQFVDKYDEFEYNSTSQMYECENLVISEVTYDQVKIGFDGGKVVKLYVKQGNVSAEGTITYNDNTLIVPANMLTLTEWETALDLESIDKYQATSEANQNYVGVKQVIIKDGDIIKFSTYHDDADNEVSYYTVEDGSYYWYSNNSSVWSKLSSTLEEYKSASLIDICDSCAELYSSFKYNRTIEAYVAENITVMGDVIDEVKLYFEDGKIKTIDMSDGVMYMTWEFTYDDTTLTLPTEFVTV